MEHQWNSVRSLRLTLTIVGVSLAVAAALAIYPNSPLLDPKFVPDSANAGPYFGWGAGIPEQKWLYGALVFALIQAALLAPWIPVAQQRRAVIELGAWTQRIVGRIILWLLLWGALSWLSVLFLLQLWIID
jgi:hypothetical protein